MKLLVFDTETSGLPKHKYSSIYNTSEWPHILQLSYIVYDLDNNEIIAQENDYIKIRTYIKISKESYNVHKISKDFLKKEHMKHCNIVVGHNVEFDQKMINVECYRRSIEIEWKPEFCTMKNSVNICKIEKVNLNNETYFKYPTLNELHVYLFKKEPKNLHDALTDIMICLRCYGKILYDKDITKKNQEIAKFIKKIV
jgi:DNA polymerase-3 subunit epsilon